MPMHVELVSPERVAYSGDAKMVIARTVSGDIAFLNGHVPFIGVRETWPVRGIQEDDQTQVIAVADLRTSSVVVTAQKDLMEQIAGMIDQIDVASPRDQRASLSRAEPSAVRYRAVRMRPNDPLPSATLSTTPASGRSEDDQNS